MSESTNLPDQTIKHLEMIQAVIARLGNNAFFIKGWAITLAGGFLALAANNDEWRLAAIALVPTLFFWILDATFLRNERLFRDLFERAREGKVEPFFMAATAHSYTRTVTEEAKTDPTKDNTASRFGAFRRESLSLFYGAIIAASIAVAVLIHCT